MRYRVVYDASCQVDFRCVSLNDNLLTGHKILHDITAVILRWQVNKFVFTADSNQMYRQILVVDYQQSTNEPIVDYRLLTVT